jgi:hypothetical protein
MENKINITCDPYTLFEVYEKLRSSTKNLERRLETLKRDRDSWKGACEDLKQLKEKQWSEQEMQINGLVDENDSLKKRLAKYPLEQIEQ